MIVFSFSFLQFSSPHLFTSLWYSPHFSFLWPSTLLLLVTINLSFSSPWLHIFFLSLSLFSYPYPFHGWFDTPRCNCLILVLSSCYGCLLLATLTLQYQCTSPFCDCLLLLLVAIFLSSSIHLPVIFFSSSLSLVNITLPIFVTIVSSPRRYHFAYPCNNYLLLYLIVFYLSWFLCFSLLQSPAQLSLSLHLLVILLYFSICLVDTTSYVLVMIVSSPSWYHFA